MIGTNRYPFFLSRRARSGRAVWGTFALAASIALALPGCGGGNASDLSGQPTPAASATPDATRATGTLIVRFALPDTAAASRLIPSQAHFLRVEILDGNTALPLTGDGNGQTADVFAIAGGETRRTYSELPLRTVTVRVTAFRESPATNPDPAQNPALAGASVPFVPRRINADGSIPGESTLPVTLASTVDDTDLQIFGEGTLYAAASSLPLQTGRVYTLQARIGDAVALTDAGLAFSNVTWSVDNVVAVTATQLEGTSTTAPAFSLKPNANGLRAADGSYQTKNITITATIQDGQGAVVTRRVTQSVRVVPLPGALNLSVIKPTNDPHRPLPGTPFGTRTVAAILTPKLNGSPEPNGSPVTVTGTVDASGNVLNFTNSVSVPAGTYSITVEAYASDNVVGDNAEDDKYLLGTTTIDDVELLPGQDRYGGTAQTTSIDYTSGYTIRPVVVKGRQYGTNGNGVSTLVDVAQIDGRQAPAANGFPFAAGQDYELQMQLVRSTNAPVTLPASDFNLAVAPAVGQVAPVATDTSATRFGLSLFSQPADVAVPLTISQRSGRVLSPTARITVQADTGAKGQVTIK